MRIKIIVLYSLAILLSACQQSEPKIPPTFTTEALEGFATTEAPDGIVATDEPTTVPIEEFQAYFEESPCPFEVPENHVEGETVRCGYVTVLEDHRAPDGRTIKLAVAIFKAKNTISEPDPLIFLSGGPGEKTIASVLPLAEHLVIFNAERDLVFFDQRGVGSSEPALECPEFVDSLFDILDEPDPSTTERTVFNAVMACKDRLVSEGHNLAAYTTTQNAADVEAIREALGYEQINLFGGSYGSLLAQAVMRDFPKNIRSVIIDSTVPMSKSLLIDIPTTAVNATLHLMESCAMDEACNTTYPDLKNVLFDIVEAHNEEPKPVSLVNPLDGISYQALMTGDMIFGNLVFFLYQTPIIPTLPKAINDVANGNYDLMVQLSSRKLAVYDALSRGMSFSVLCTDDLLERTPEDYLNIRAAMPPPLAGRTDPEDVLEYGYFAICQNWPVKKADPSVRNPVVSDIPTLILGGEYDPVTPPEYGRMVAEHLNNSYFFEFPSIGHSVAVSNECARQMTTEFLANPTTEPDGTCRETLAIEFVLPIDFENIKLIPVTISEFGIQAVVPESWTRVAPEYYVSPDTTIELVIKEDTNNNREQFLKRWGASDVISEITHNNLTWTLYEANITDYNIAGYIATTPSDGGYFLVLIVTTSAQQELLFDSVFIPIIEAFRYDESIKDTAEAEGITPAITAKLTPFEDEAFKIRGLLPEGWTQVQPGVHARGDSASDQTMLIQKSYEGMTMEALVDALLPGLQLDELPAPSGERETASFSWTLCQTSISAPGVGTYIIDMALSEFEGKPHLVLLQSETGEHDNSSIYEDIFLEIIDAMEPLE
jgi:pimeloyl-ACP methyl ester carboxylesterase